MAALVQERVTASEVLRPGKVAVVTGASSGIGKAMCVKLVDLGLKVYMVDIDAGELERAAEEVKGIGVVADVADAAAMEAVATRVFTESGGCHFVALNAGVGRGGGPFEAIDRYHATLGVNFYGVVHGVQAFVPKMKSKGLVVCTGSKQGITAPPGNLVYNVSKAALKCYVEGLEHDLRTNKQHLSAALLIPGWVNTGIMRKSKRDEAIEAGEQFSPDDCFFHEGKPAKGAWDSAQVVDFMIQELDKGRFYIVCPDNDVTRLVDNARMTWSMQDITLDRPPLSRWHPDYKDAFSDFLKRETEQ